MDRRHSAVPAKTPATLAFRQSHDVQLLGRLMHVLRVSCPDPFESIKQNWVCVLHDSSPQVNDAEGLSLVGVDVGRLSTFLPDISEQSTAR